jgi:protein involved in polysaccharide export with SLBB domain
MPAFSTVLTALALSNGVAKTGSLRNIYIYRKNNLFKKLDIYDLITDGNNKNDIVLKNSDIIYVPYIGPTVAIVGAVVRPGIFELPLDNTASHETIKALLKLAGGTLHQAHSKIYIRRIKNHQNLEIKEVSLSQINKKFIAPHNGDLIEVRYVNIGMTTTVKLKGHVWQPMEKNYHKGLRLSQLLNDPSNIKPGAITNFAIIKRYIPIASEYTTIRFPLKRVLKGKFDMDLRPYDEIYILAKKDFNIQQPVYITGAVWRPGEYQVEPNLTVSGLIAKAGGLKYGANKHRIELSRQYILQNHIETKHQIIDLDKTDVSLQPYDSIHVPLLNQAGQIRRVSIKGEVKYPGIYTIKDGEHLSDLIQRAGGFTDKAYFYGAKYTTLRAKEIQQKSIDRLIQDLEIRAQQVISEQAQTAVSKEDAESAKAAQSSIQSLINRLKTIKAEGRVSIFLTDIKSFKGSKYDFELGDGDTLEIPKRPNFVAVVGSVYSPGAFLYEPNKPLKFYLQKSGGPTKTADEDYVYVLKANGEVVSKAQNSGIFTSFYSMKLMPGDTIVVPENLERIPYLRLVRDISDIVFKIATTAGIAMAVF